MEALSFSLDGGLLGAELVLRRFTGNEMLRRGRLIATFRLVGRSNPDDGMMLLALSVEVGAGRSQGPYVFVGDMNCERAIGAALDAGAPVQDLDCELRLDSQQIEALDALRGPEGLTFHLRLTARYHRRKQTFAGDAHSMQHQLVLNPMEWTQLLRSMGHRGYVFIEIPIPNQAPEELRRAVELIGEAQIALHTQPARDVVVRCRMALEALEAALKDGPILGALNAGSSENTKEERIGLVRRAAQKLNHLAMHEGEVAGKTVWTRDDAVAALGLTASIVRWYAVRE
jgi:hypothetical protein